MIGPALQWRSPPIGGGAPSTNRKKVEKEYHQGMYQGARMVRRSCVGGIAGRRPSLPRPAIPPTQLRHVSSTPAPPADTDHKGFGDVILNPSLRERLQQLAAAAAADAKPFRRNLLFVGPPGTGKRMAAEELASRCGLDCTMMRADGVAPLGPQALTKLHKQSDRLSRKPHKGLLLCIDESDRFLREGNDVWMCETYRSAVMNALLSGTAPPSKHTVLVLTQNMAGDLDPDVTARIDESLEFPMPGVEERFELLKLYLDKTIAQGGEGKRGEQKKIEIKGLTDDVIRRATDNTKGFSGSDIAELMDSMRSLGSQSEHCVLDPDLFCQWLHEYKIIVPRWSY